MDSSVYQHMQSAVDAVQASEHPSNKIAAMIAGKDAGGRDFALSKPNFWPQAIKEKIGADVKIGGSSGTIHAETACLIAAPMTEGSSLFVTDPPCPNCVKNMVEAGVRALYIDHKGFDKDFAARRGEHFADMSLRFCEKAGIPVYKIFRKEKRVENILEIPAGYEPAVERPALVTPLEGALDDAGFRAWIKAFQTNYDRRSFAAAVAQDISGKRFGISAEIHAIAGFTAKDPLEAGKYNHFLQPVTRVMMTAARRGLKIDKNYLFSSRVPTARELVNMVGAGFEKLWLGDESAARDENGMEALNQFLNAKILRSQMMKI